MLLEEFSAPETAGPGCHTHPSVPCKVKIIISQGRLKVFSKHSRTSLEVVSRATDDPKQIRQPKFSQ